MKIRSLVLPDSFIDHGKPETMYERAGLASGGIVSAVFNALGRDGLQRELNDRA